MYQKPFEEMSHSELEQARKSAADRFNNRMISFNELQTIRKAIDDCMDKLHVRQKDRINMKLMEKDSGDRFLTQEEREHAMIRLKAFRITAGLSEGQAAKLLEMSKTHLCLIEDNALGAIERSTVQKMMNLYHVSWEDLMAEQFWFEDERQAVNAMKKGEISVGEFIRWSLCDHLVTQWFNNREH